MQLALTTQAADVEAVDMRAGLNSTVRVPFGVECCSIWAPSTPRLSPSSTIDFSFQIGGVSYRGR
jgi:hypothetical protein